jgi:FkbM family methyltransferase
MSDFPPQPFMLSEAERVLMTVSCRDCDNLAKVPNAGGTVVDGRSEKWQIMFNGVEVLYGGYYGEWMAEIIRRLNGHHEPQEERVFFEVMKRIRPGATMIELGCFWGYYSIWFARQVPAAKLVMLEPDPDHLAVARRNLERNGLKATLVEAAIGETGRGEIFIESENRSRSVAFISVPDLVKKSGVDFIDILHVDIQGQELNVIKSIDDLVQSNRLRFIFVSTHHHSISGDPLIHQKCLHRLTSLGAHIIAEHSVSESFSGDGMIVASFQKCDTDLAVDVSHNRAATSLFRPLEFDLHDATRSTS